MTDFAKNRERQGENRNSCLYALPNWALAVSMKSLKKLGECSNLKKAVVELDIDAVNLGFEDFFEESHEIILRLYPIEPAARNILCIGSKKVLIGPSEDEVFEIGISAVKNEIMRVESDTTTCLLARNHSDSRFSLEIAARFGARRFPFTNESIFALRMEFLSELFENMNGG